MSNPLSQKTLDKRYAELGLSQSKLELLRRYYRCFANLYGMVSVDEAWDIFKYYEGPKLLSKAAFVAFSGVAARDGSLPYCIVEIDKVFGAEEPLPENRLIVSKKALIIGHNKYIRLYDIDDGRVRHNSPFVPKKDALFSFEDDIFYKKETGRKFADFICAMRSTGTATFLNGKTRDLYDINGQSVKGKRLDSFTIQTVDDETIEILRKNESAREKLREHYTVVPSERLLKLCEILTLSDSEKHGISNLQVILDTAIEEFGIAFTKEQLERFVTLYQNLHNDSNAWYMFGWSPNELIKKRGISMPTIMSICRNIKND